MKKIMNLWAVFAALAMLFAFNSCKNSDDDDEAPSPNSETASSDGTGGTISDPTDTVYSVTYNGEKLETLSDEEAAWYKKFLAENIDYTVDTTTNTITLTRTGAGKVAPSKVEESEVNESVLWTAPHSSKEAEDEWAQPGDFKTVLLKNPEMGKYELVLTTDVEDTRIEICKGLSYSIELFWDDVSPKTQEKFGWGDNGFGSKQLFLPEVGTYRIVMEDWDSGLWSVSQISDAYNSYLVLYNGKGIDAITDSEVEAYIKKFDSDQYTVNTADKTITLTREGYAKALGVDLYTEYTFTDADAGEVTVKAYCDETYVATVNNNGTAQTVEEGTFYIKQGYMFATALKKLSESTGNLESTKSEYPVRYKIGENNVLTIIVEPRYIAFFSSEFKTCLADSSNCIENDYGLFVPLNFINAGTLATVSFIYDNTKIPSWCDDGELIFAVTENTDFNFLLGTDDDMSIGLDSHKLTRSFSSPHVYGFSNGKEYEIRIYNTDEVILAVLEVQ